MLLLAKVYPIFPRMAMIDEGDADATEEKAHELFLSDTDDTLSVMR